MGDGQGHFRARNPMAARQIPSLEQGLPPAGIGACGVRRYFDRSRPVSSGDLRRHGRVSVRFPWFRPARGGRGLGMNTQRHISVLGREAVESLAPRAGGIYVDATFGAGGYSRAILDVPGTRLIAIDRDRTAIAGGAELVGQAAGRLTLVEDRFSNLAEVCEAQGVETIDGVVMDVGVSSMQLDQAGRGFSFRLDGPLDMRMGQAGPSAADVIAKASETDLADIIYLFGEERHSR